MHGQIKFRVGQIVWLALSKDGEGGLRLPEGEMRQAAVEAESHKFQLPGPGDMRFNWIHVRLEAIDADEMRDIVARRRGQGRAALCRDRSTAAPRATSRCSCVTCPTESACAPLPHGGRRSPSSSLRPTPSRRSRRASGAWRPGASRTGRGTGSGSRTGSLAVMAAADLELGYAGAKIYAGFRDGARFVVLLFRADTPELVAVIEADKLGQLPHRRGERRRREAPRRERREQPRPDRLRLAGASRSSRASAPRFRDLERVVAYCRTRSGSRAFCEEHGAEPGESHQDPAECDVVVTVTTSADPVLRGEWLQPGALVCAVGANDGRRRELDNVVLERAAFVCCDSLERREARVRRSDRAGRVGRPRLARGARAAGGRRRRAARAASRTRTSSSSSPTASRHGTSLSRPPSSSARGRRASGSEVA